MGVAGRVVDVDSVIGPAFLEDWGREWRDGERWIVLDYGDGNGFGLGVKGGLGCGLEGGDVGGFSGSALTRLVGVHGQ